MVTEGEQGQVAESAQSRYVLVLKNNWIMWIQTMDALMLKDYCVCAHVCVCVCLKGVT